MKLVISNFTTYIKKAWEVDKKYFLYIFFYFMGVSVFAYHMIKLPKMVLDMISTSSIHNSKVLTTILILLVSALISSYSRVLFTPIGNKLRYEYLFDLFDQTISMPYEDYDNPSTQKSIMNNMRAVSSVEGVQGYYTNFALFIGNLGVLVVSISILWRIQLWISLLIFIWFIVYIVISMKASNKIDMNNKKHIDLTRQRLYFDDLAMDLSYGKEIRVFQLQDWLQNHLKSIHHRIVKTYGVNEGIANIPDILNDIYQFVRDSAIYIFLILLYFKGNLTTGEFTSYSVLILQLNNALMAGASNLRQMLSMQDTHHDMLEYIKKPKQSNEGKSVELKESFEIRFEDVSFKYPGTERFIYENLNFTINSGKKIAIVGMNGTGKTTLLKLLLRLYQPTSGRITMNGTDIKEFKLFEYFALFAPVFQEINLFPFTIQENLSFQYNNSKEELLEALFHAGLDVEEWKDKDFNNTFMTRHLHSDGISLSGGQSQKFVTARAFATKRPIYILDEPTSALDALAESKFYEQVDNNMQDKTVLFVSHRMASTQFCDEIILIEDGTIKECGTHNELLNKNGRYAEIFSVQAKYYQSEVAE